jgi:hypothetical protein
MPLPTFDVAPRVARQTVTRTHAARRLGLHPAGVDMLVHAGIFRLPLRATTVGQLAARPCLQVADGELTVLRTSARAAGYPGDDRACVGFHAEHTDAELEETSLRWWKSDPGRVLDNELFVVTVSTFPVAVYRIVGHVASRVREGEVEFHHHYAGQLLARVHPDLAPVFSPATPAPLHRLARQVMDSRIVVASGGRIGYLGSATSSHRPPPPAFSAR